MVSETPTYAVDFADGITEQLSLTPLGTGHYRAEQSSSADDSVNFGDIIAAEPTANGGLRFLSVLQKSQYTTLRWLISKRAAESAGLTAFLEQVTEVGGLWERTMGGVLILHLPQTPTFDAEREFKRQTES
jgi:hypothetical protein